MSEAAFVRRGRRNAHFTAISNALVDHPSLSPDARIALIYLLSKPENWALQIEDLRRVLGTGGQACGRNKAYEVLKELKACAYVVPVECVNDRKAGRFGVINYYVFDEPHDDPAGFARGKGGRLPPAKSGRQGPTEGGDGADVSPHPQNREAVAPPLPRTPHPENRDATKERGSQKTESPLLSPAEAVSVPPSREGRFDDLWSDWPEGERPRARGYAERVFDRLTPEERRQALRLASSYRSRCKGAGEPAFMIPFLKGRFRELVEAPPIDREGYFVITLDRPEWSEWITHCRARFSPKVCADIEGRGVLLRRTRWPEDRP